MCCILCVKEQNELINIFDEHGLNINVCNVITKHFWLQPSEEDPNCNVICSFCWNKLQSFHTFYKEIEQAHVKLLNITQNEVKGDTVAGAIDAVESCSDTVVTDIKVEFFEDTKVDLQQMNIETSTNPLEVNDVQNIKSDSESEIPLSKLLKHQKLQKNENHSICSSKKLKKRTNSTTDEESEDNGTTADGSSSEWPVISYAEEVNHKISPNQLDRVISSMMKLCCHLCSTPLENFADLRDHYQAAHNEVGYVACCDKTFNKRCTLVDHILSHKYPYYFKCSTCDKVMGNRKNYKEHMKCHDKKLIYACDKCSKSFHRKILLDRHMDIHVSERTFKCDECNKLFASKFSLGQHVYGVHKGGYTKVCEQCGKVTRDQDALRRHQLEHTNEPKPFVTCSKCGVRLANRAGLLRHMRSQHIENNITHVCNVCGSTASSIYALKRHITYMHKYERSFKCPMCDKGFKRAIVLKSHNIVTIMSCILCVRILNDEINIFDEEGIRLDIANVITKHFWLQPNAEDANKRIICCSCWNTLQSFHKFYQKIETAHFNLANVKQPDPFDLSKNEDFHNYPQLFKEVAVSDIKSESSFEDNEANSQNVDVELEKPDDNETKDEIKSDSDFDSLVLKLRKHRKPTIVENTEQSGSDSDDSNDDSPSKKKSRTQKHHDYKVTPNKESQKNTSVSLRESNKRTVPCKQFDAFIKQNMKLTCNICNVPLENFFALKEHYRSAHNEIGYVTCCEKKFDSRHALVHHITMHKNPETFKCEKCGRVLADNRGLKRHMKTTHVNEERIHQCHICKKGFRRKEILERHLKTHVKREHICEQCGRVFRGKQNFQQHQLRDHSGIPKERLQCQKCGVYLADASTLYTHMKYQHPVTVVVHKCTICGKISSTGYGLKRHIQYMHTRGRPHKCTLCEKAFKTLKCLRVSLVYF